MRNTGKITWTIPSKRQMSKPFPYLRWTMGMAWRLDIISVSICELSAINLCGQISDMMELMKITMIGVEAKHEVPIQSPP